MKAKHWPTLSTNAQREQSFPKSGRSLYNPKTQLWSWQVFRFEIPVWTTADGSNFGRVLQHCLCQAYFQIDLHKQELIIRVMTGTRCGHHFQVLHLFQNPRNLVIITRHLCLNLQSQEGSYLPAGQECQHRNDNTAEELPLPRSQPSPQFKYQQQSQNSSWRERAPRIAKKPILLLCYRLF